MGRVSSSAPSLESRVRALDLYSWLEADTYTVDGGTGKVASFDDKVRSGTGIRAITAAHAIAQATGANQAVVPAADANYGGRVSALFGGVIKNYVSNAPASAWKFLHGGTGGTAYYAMKQDNTSGGYLAYTYGATRGMWIGMGASIYNLIIAGDVQISAAGPACGTSPVVLKYAYEEGRAPKEHTMRVSLGTEIGANTSAPPDNNDAATLTIAPTSAGPWDGSFVLAIHLTHVATDNEDALIRAYISSKYGVT